MSERSVTHSTFVIERRYPASPARVFAAWADPAAKVRWFGFKGPDAWQSSNHQLDFRVGGRESLSSGPPGGPVHSYNACYQDIVPNERIVSSYEMHLNELRTSVSLVTVELKAEGDGTRLLFTEQGAFLDGHDNAERREQGMRVLLDNLEEMLRGASEAT